MSSSDNDHDWDKSVYTQDYVAVILGYLTTLIMIFLTATFLNRYSKHKTNSTAAPREDVSVEQNTIKIITRVSIVAIFLYLAAAILITITLTKWILIDKEHGIQLNSIMITFSIVPYTFNLFVSLFFILAQRLNLLLKSRCIHVMSYVLPAVSFSICIVARLITRYAVFELTPILAPLNSIIMLGVLLIYLAFAIIYVAQISKMMKIRIDANMKTRCIEIDKNKTNVTAAADEENREPNEVLVTFKTVEDTIRCGLLVVICALSSFIVPISIPITTERHADHLNTLNHIAGLIDTVVNAVCVFLLFGFAERDYLNVCGVCHRCILNACLKREYRRFRKTNVDLKGLETHDQFVSLIVDD